MVPSRVVAAAPAVARSPVVARTTLLATPARSGRAPRMSLCAKADAVELAVELEAKKVEEEEEEEDLMLETGDGFSTEEVQNLVGVVCEETNIAELELNMDGCKVKLRRNLGVAGVAGPAGTAAAPATAPDAAAEGAFPMASIDDAASESEASMDESLMYVYSPKVGIMRRALFNKAGKKVGTGPAEGDAVKKGQALCSIEQLGTYVPVHAPQQGEVVAFEVEDGAPVEYNQEVVEILPYFGGHIIGDSKYA